MQKITQPDLSDKALDVAVQPLTEAEILQVSGGNGPNRFMGGMVRTSTSQPNRGTAMSGKTVYTG